MERDQIRSLLDLKHANHDIFYRVLSEMPVDGVNNLCKTAVEFRKLCLSQEFWITLWKIKVPLPVPDLNDIGRLKTRYLRYASMADLARFLFENPEIEVSVNPEGEQIQGRTKDEIFNSLIYYQRIIQGKHSLMNVEMFEVGVKHNNLDCLLFVINSGFTMGYLDIDKLLEYKRGELFNRLFSMLTEDNFRFIFPNLSAYDIIRIPGSRNCNINLLKKYFAGKRIACSDDCLGSSLELAATNKCDELFDYLLSKIKINKSYVQNRELFISNTYTRLRRNKLYNYLERFLDKLSVEDKKTIENVKLNYGKRRNR